MRASAVGFFVLLLLAVSAFPVAAANGLGGNFTNFES
jgi:hypothetical protein